MYLCWFENGDGRAHEKHENKLNSPNVLNALGSTFFQSLYAMQFCRHIDFNLMRPQVEKSVERLCDWNSTYENSQITNKCCLKLLNSRWFAIAAIENQYTRHLPKRNKNTCPHNNFHGNVHSSFIHQSKILERTNPMSLNWQRNNYSAVSTADTQQQNGKSRKHYAE